MVTFGNKSSFCTCRVYLKRQRGRKYFYAGCNYKGSVLAIDLTSVNLWANVCQQVMGLTVLRRRLYSVHSSSNKVYIHETTKPFIRVGQPEISGLKWPRGLAASQRHGCVFITDWYKTFRGRLWRANENVTEVLHSICYF